VAARYYRDLLVLSSTCHPIRRLALRDHADGNLSRYLSRARQSALGAVPLQRFFQGAQNHPC